MILALILTQSPDLAQATLLESLQHELQSHDSATLVLDDWCARRHLAPEGTHIVAERDAAPAAAVPANVRMLLKVSESEPVRYRRVRLRCGDHVLSEAENWYVPARLTPAMNQALDTSDIAFGRAVKLLGFHRESVSAKITWSPVVGQPMPHRVIENRAVLMLPDGTPFSHVVENYTSDVLSGTP